MILIAVNLLPIVGVLFWGWNIFEIVMLYWFENVVIGAVNILKMLTATGEMTAEDGYDRNGMKADPEMPHYLNAPVGGGVANHAAKLFLIPFFTVHYGMFCFVHGIFVVTLLGGKASRMLDGGPIAMIEKSVPEAFASGGQWFAIAIIASHLFSFFFNFLGKGEFRKTSAPEQMGAPYGRIVVLHIAILFGAFVITALGSPVFLLILLIIGKIVLDVKLHQRSHRKLAAIGRD